jgi:L-ascorbate metabolism protein UlaG (beta-lactamase superfamily)
MDSLPRAAADRRRARTRQSGATPIAFLAVLLTLALAAGVSIRADRLFDREPAPSPRVELPARADGHGATGRAIDVARIGGSPISGDVARGGGSPIVEDAAPGGGSPVAGEAAVAGDARPHADVDGPALARAAEAGLQRMRVQFPQPLPPALPEAPIEVRDLRDPGAQRDAGRPAAQAPAPQRRLTLPPPERLMRLPPAEGSVTLVGESTVLIRSHGLTVLTDPGFLRRGERARMGWGLSATRRADPAIDLDELPPVDVVVITRLREDRFDPVARRRLPRDVPIVAPAEARAELVSMGFSSVHALPPWGSLRVARGGALLTLTATPTRAGLPLPSALAPASMGALLEFGSDDGADRFGYRIWVSGDTRIDDGLLAELGPRLAGVDLALLHVGGGLVPGLGGSMDAAAGLSAARRLGARTALPLRLGDYGGAPVPARASSAAAQRVAGEPSVPRVRVLERGDVHRFAPVQHWALADEFATAR